MEALAFGATVIPCPSAAMMFTFVPVTVAYAMAMPFLATMFTFFRATLFTGDSGRPMMTPAQALLVDLRFSMVMSWKNGVRRWIGSAGPFPAASPVGRDPLMRMAGLMSCA